MIGCRLVSALLVLVTSVAGSSGVLRAQGGVRPLLSDSARPIGPVDTLSYAQYRAAVLANHPVARQAQLVAAQARSRLQEAWGAFEPQLSLSLSQKSYRAEPYYNYVDGALRVPTLIGADVKLGFERAMGTNINPDRSTPALGLLTLGLSIPLGQGIITDQRRTDLAQARALRDVGDAKAQSILNYLLLDAGKAYGAWYAAARRAEIAEEGYRNAVFRLSAVRLRFLAGDAPAIDTVEAALEVQRRLVSRREAATDRRVATLDVARFLWDGSGRPLEPDTTTGPSIVGLDSTRADTTQLVNWLRAVEERHPELRIANARIRVEAAERLYAAQALLPDAYGTLYSIAPRGSADDLTRRDRWNTNYKGGLEASTSLLLIGERGKLSGASQRLESVRLDRDIIRRDLAYALRIALVELELLEELILLQRSNVTSATLLRDAEQVRFEAGESTLLTVNLRERLVLDEAVKLAMLEGKLAGARAGLAAAIGDGRLLPFE